MQHRAGLLQRQPAEALLLAGDDARAAGQLDGEVRRRERRVELHVPEPPRLYKRALVAVDDAYGKPVLRSIVIETRSKRGADDAPDPALVVGRTDALTTTTGRP